MEEPKTNILMSCGFIKSIILSHGLTEIEEDVFYDCRNLETAVIPETVIKIGPYAFSWSGLKSITLLDGRLTEIGKGAFIRCKKLDTIIIPKTITKIAPYVFA